MTDKQDEKDKVAALQALADAPARAGVKDHRLDDEDAPADGKKSYPLHDVLVDRDKTKIMVHVPEHEIPVLEAIHGENKITDTGKSDFDIELPSDATSELERLRTKYRQPNRPDVINQVFRNGAADIKGFDHDKSAKASKAPKNAVRDNRKKSSRAK